ncbi:hypothetical protein IWZ00DRAFT_552428 [Phyllosticta capitalensis]
MRFRPLRLERLLTLLLLLLLLFAALSLPLYSLSFNKAIPSASHPLTLIPRTDLSGGWSDNPLPGNNDLSSTCKAHPNPTTTSTTPQNTSNSNPTESPSQSPIPQCLYNTTGCGFIFRLVQTCHQSLFPDSSNAYAITPGNPAQAARLRGCICTSPPTSYSAATSAAGKNAAWTRCLACLHNGTRASQTDLETQSRALQAFCQAPGVPDAVGWLQRFERWIEAVAPGAIGGGGAGGDCERPVLSGGVTAVLTMTETQTPTGGVVGTPEMATQAQTDADASSTTTADGDGDGEGDVVTSVYSVNGQTTLLIVKPAPSTTASATETGYTKSSASRRTAIVSTAAATTATEQASDAARRFQTPPIGNGDMAFGVGLGVFVFLGVVRMLLD